MGEKFCQSCGMPLEGSEFLGSNADGSKCEEYCSYCYENGAFQQDCTMEEMIDFCLTHSESEGFFADKEQAKRQMLEWFPTLKRWKKA